MSCTCRRSTRDRSPVQSPRRRFPRYTANRWWIRSKTCTFQGHSRRRDSPSCSAGAYRWGKLCIPSHPSHSSRIQGYRQCTRRSRRTSRTPSNTSCTPRHLLSPKTFRQRNLCTRPIHTRLGTSQSHTVCSLRLPNPRTFPGSRPCSSRSPTPMSCLPDTPCMSSTQY